MDKHEKAKQATPHAVMIEQLLDSRVPKNEREHAAGREVVRLRAERDALLADALRYRHIRNPDQPHIEKAAYVMVWEGDGYVPFFGAELDAEIDDEMAGGK